MSLEKTTTSSTSATENSASPIDHNMLKHFRDIMGPEMTITLTEQFVTYGSQQIVALQQSIAQANSETLRHQIHQLKGESLQIGANQLGALCEQLEILAQEGQLETAPAHLAQIETEWAKVKAVLSQEQNYDK